MNNKNPDIVSLKWVIGLMNNQADNAEAALVEYSNDPSQKQPLLRCMWAVHQVTSTLRALGMRKAEMLTLEMERSLNYLYKDKLVGERRKLAMGGLMQALKVIPAYLEHVQDVRHDTGRGLEQYVNDLRRWSGEKPRPRAFFFHMSVPPNVGISPDASGGSDEEVRKRANVMLALYLEMAKQGLRRRNVADSMKTVARISRKMQSLFAGSEAERYWFTMIGICEGIAGGLIVPDECIAQIFKAGAFSIKAAREKGRQLDKSINYDDLLQQMLFYVASCRSKPVHISSIRETFGITDSTLADSNHGLVHTDAIIIAINGALEQLNTVVEGINSRQEATEEGDEAPSGDLADDRTVTDALDAAEARLVAAGQLAHADSLNAAVKRMERSGGDDGDLIRVIVEVRQDLEHKLQHGLSSAVSGHDYELRENVVTATFNQMGCVENYLHQILRRKALKAALEKKPADEEATLRLTMALHRYLNKSDQGYEELRKAVKDADGGDPDLDLLYSLAKDFLDEQETMPDRKAIEKSLELMEDIVGALTFAGMEKESGIIQQCHNWLSAASDAGSVREDDAFRCFADAFAQVEMHMQRSLIDPLDDTSHLMALAQQRADELGEWAEQLSPGRTAAVKPVQAAEDLEDRTLVEDGDIPDEFRDVFIEESEEIVAELGQLTAEWLKEPEANEVLRDIRRHFHTFKGNGRAVGANILGELGWAAQDMLDRSLDGDLSPGDALQRLVDEVVKALPDLVASYSNDEGPDIDRIRKLTDDCFALAGSTNAKSGEPLTH
ncbi:MAG: Hpt domain-containing protein [Pseudomonadota bacterium]